MKLEAARFECESDDGERYTVVEFQNYVKFRPVSGRSEELPTTKEWALQGGGFVNQIDVNTYKIVETDTIIRKI